jgi:hypothetical protein
MARRSEPGFYGSMKTASDNCAGVLIQVGNIFQCGLPTSPNFNEGYQPNGYIYTDPYGRVYTAHGRNHDTILESQSTDGERLKEAESRHGVSSTVTYSGGGRLNLVRLRLPATRRRIGR